MSDLELFIRWRLGQRDFTSVNTGIRPDHLRFDMSFGIYTSSEDDPILGLFSDIIPSSQDKVILRFWKGARAIYLSSYHIVEVSDYKSGLGTVDIISEIIKLHKCKIPKDEIRDIKLRIIGV